MPYPQAACPEAPCLAPQAWLTPRAPRAFEVVVAVTGPHLRAARALLGWAMSDLAEVSGLSLSTIRRLEQNVQAVSLRNRHAAVEALETSGIRFLKLGDGTIALAEPGGHSLPEQKAQA